LLAWTTLHRRRRHPNGGRVFELVESTHRYLLTREEDGYAIWDTEGGVDEPVEAFPLTDEQEARDLFQSMRSEGRRERIVPTVLFWAAILGGIAWMSARVVLGLGYLSTVRPFRSSGQWLLWAQAAETITFAVFIGASVLYVVLWISRRAPS
jgi:hypothetical protein